MVNPGGMEGGRERSPHNSGWFCKIWAFNAAALSRATVPNRDVKERIGNFMITSADCREIALIGNGRIMDKRGRSRTEIRDSQHDA